MYILDGWQVSDRARNRKSRLINGNRMLMGNGYLGYRGTVDESGAGDMQALIVSGLYDQRENLWREPVNWPNPLYVALMDTNGRSLILDKDVSNESEQGTPSIPAMEHEQALNFRYGVFSRRTVWNIDGVQVTVVSERFAHRSIYPLLCRSYTIQADGAIPLIVKRGINRFITDINGPHLGGFESKYRPWGKKAESSSSKDSMNRIQGFHMLRCHTLERHIPLAVSLASEPILQEGLSIPELLDSLEYTQIQLEAGIPITFISYAALCFDAGGEEPLPSELNDEDPVEYRAIKIVEDAACKGYATLFASHREAWDQIWNRGAVEIFGDENACAALRYSLYQLQIAAPRHRDSLSVPARALSGQTYKGAVFWDTELFIAPYFLCTEKDVALRFIRYRIAGLPGARQKAAEYGYRGAFYAWESQEQGAEACSLFNVTDVFTLRPLRTYFRDKQIHISAAPVYALREYLNAGGDMTILKEGGLEMVLECARFFLSYSIYFPDRQQYELRDVTGPDEYHERVNNDAYTNRMAKLVLDCALDYVELFRKQDPDFLDSLLIKLDYTRDLAFLSELASRLYIPEPDPDGLIEQFEGYFSLEDATPQVLRERLLDPREYWGGGTGVATNTQVIKQADVVLLQALFGSEYTHDEKLINLRFYEDRTEHGSSLSACMHALLHCEVGDSDPAYHYFLRTAELDLCGEAKEYAGLVYIGGTHPAAAGGAWLATVRGFCGFHIEDGRPVLQPRLPAAWSKVVFRTELRGRLACIEVEKDGYKICWM